MSDAPSSSARRRALAVLAGVGGAGACLAGIPAARLAASPGLRASGEARWIPVAKLAELPEGTPRRVKVIADHQDGWAVEKAQALGAVWLVRRGAVVSVLSAICPHSGCTVDLGPDGKGYYCACHNSFFDEKGEKPEGKPNKALRGLDPLEARVVGDAKVVEVKWQRFTLGTKTREVIG
jgi:cytochrome b6-f complex iron-sulfur subunit/menaquinol-cytochrome c reductase iron-sulfur subunit